MSTNVMVEGRKERWEGGNIGGSEEGRKERITLQLAAGGLNCMEV